MTTKVRIRRIRCKHGAQIPFERQMIPWNAGLYTRYEPGPVDVLPPGCETPDECMRVVISKLNSGELVIRTSESRWWMELAA